MTIFIPTIGSVLTLRSEWKFDLLIDEWRNIEFAKFIGLHDKNAHRMDIQRAAWREIRETAEPLHQKTAQVTLPAGTELKVDRIYIRRGSSGFDSISFYVQLPDPARPKAKMKTKRFFAALSEVNRIDGAWRDQADAPTIPLTSLTLEELNNREEAINRHLENIHEARREIINRGELNGTKRGKA